MLKKNQEADSPLRLNVARVYRFGKPGMYRPEDIEPFRKRIQGPSGTAPFASVTPRRVMLRISATGEGMMVSKRPPSSSCKSTL